MSWQIKKMPEVVKWSSGGTPKRTEKEYYENGTIPWLIISDLNNSVVTTSETKITESGLKNSSAKMIPEGTLLVAMYGSIGKLGITGIECCTNQAIAFAKELYSVTTKYMFYYLASIKSKLIQNGKGGTQKNISLTVLNSFSVPVPPIEEQRRIVSRIEELFSELDSAVETLQKTRQQLEIYRQAVLKEAFENCKIQVRFGDIIISRLGKMLDKKKNVGVERTYLRNANVRWFDFDLSNLLQMRITDDEIDRYSLHKGDLVICEGGEPGRCAIWKKDEMIFYQKALHRVRFKTKCKPEFYMYYMSYIAKTGTINEYFTGTGIKHLTGESLSKIPVPSTSYSQQEKITSEIELKMSVCDSIEKTVNEALQQAEAMRQSILKKAFEGEL